MHPRRFPVASVVHLCFNKNVLPTFRPPPPVTSLSPAFPQLLHLTRWPQCSLSDSSQKSKHDF